VTCGICGGQARPFLCVRDYNRRVSDEVFHYHRCEECQSLFLDPAPDDLGPYYPDDYYQFPLTLAARAAAAEPERHKLDLLARYVPQGSVLEIGPGGGGFAFLAERAGYDFTAIEMEGEACRYLEEQVGVKVMHSADPRGAMEESGHIYDAIAMWHVLEHLRDPIAVLATAARLVRPGGSLVVAVPNPAALQLRIFRRFWTHIDAPRHLQLIPSRRLVEALTRLGLEVVFNTCTDEGGLGWDAFGWQFSTANLLTGPLAWLPRFRLLRLLRPLAAVVVALARPLERRPGRGTTYTLVATRPQD
jgi:2-polyprenyl-3-methyl-5-hydroxy-6-metoxy-1,4-benzoquinol methylase